MNRRTRR
jgi:hypothetical protein